MTAAIIDGEAYAEDLEREVAAEVATLTAGGTRPGLATVVAGDDYGAHMYERRVRKVAEQVGCYYVSERLPADVDQHDAVADIGKLDADPRISGILVLRPLPAHISELALYRALTPLKDIEAVHPINAGLLALGMPRFVPSTPASVFQLLDRYYRDTGRDPDDVLGRSLMVVVGRSNNVGKSTVLLGFARGATVVSCDVSTYKAGVLYDLTRQADILVSATGAPGLITGDHVKDGVVAVDVGINPVPDPQTGRTRLTGDLDFDSVAERAEAITPVPGGVGPVTDIWLLRTTVKAAKLQAAQDG